VHYDRLTTAEKAANYWEASQDLYKNKEPVNWDDMDFKVTPRTSDESEAEYHHRRMIGELIQEQIEKRHGSE